MASRGTIGFLKPLRRRILADRQNAQATLLILVLLLSVGILIAGWVTGLDAIVRFGSERPAMVPTTAIGFAALTIGHIGLWRQRTKRSRGALRVVAFGVGGMALVNLIVVACGILPQGLDSVLWPSAIAGSKDAMAPATSVGLLLAALASVELQRTGGPRRAPFKTSTTVGLAIGLTGCVAYLVDHAAFHHVLPFSAMSMQTAIAFVLLFGAIMLSEPGGGWLGVLFGPLNGSSGARRLIPVVVTGPLIVAVIGTVAVRQNWIVPNLEVVLMTILLILIGAAAVLRNAVLQNRIETNQLHALSSLEKAAQEKDVLLREISHRVKNNLQRIDAMLAFESGRLNDPAAAQAFGAMSHRVRALATVHELLLQSASYSEIDLGRYLRELTRKISEGQGLAERGIDLSCTGEVVFIDYEIANTVGLLANELIANAVRHAFPVGKTGTIHVHLARTSETSCELMVRDSGEGDTRFDPNEPNRGGTGSRILRALVRQLKGELRVESNGGTCVILQFPCGPFGWDPCV